jgi:hypothetical protein
MIVNGRARRTSALRVDQNGRPLSLMPEWRQGRYARAIHRFMETANCSDPLF